MATLDLDILQGSLEKLVDDTPEMQGSAVVSPDGLILVSTFQDRDQNDRLAAMASELLNAGTMTVRELGFGDFFANMVLGAEGGAIVRGVDEEMVLCALIKRGANIGQVWQQINRTVTRLKAL